MNWKYMKWQARQWLALTFVTFLVMFVPVFFTALFVDYMPTGYYSYDNAEYTVSYALASTPFLIVASMACFMSFVIPIFVCDYRFKRRSADLFLQAPMSKGGMLRNRSMLGLFILDIDFTLAYWLSFIIAYIKQAIFNNNAEYLKDNNLTQFVAENGAYYYNFGAVLSCFLVTIIMLSLAYYVNVYVASLGTNARTAILFEIIASFVLTLGLFPFTLYLVLNDSISYDYLALPLGSMGAINAVIAPYLFFDYAIMHGEYIVYAIPELNMFNFVMYIIYNVLFVALGGVAAYFVNRGLKESGEEMGKNMPTKTFPRLFVHIFFFYIALMISAGSVVSNFIGYEILTMLGTTVSFALYSYLGIALIYMKFKLDKSDWIGWIINVGALVAFQIISIICYEVNQNNIIQY